MWFTDHPARCGNHSIHSSETAPQTPRKYWSGESSSLGAPYPCTGTVPACKTPPFQLFQDRAPGRAPQAPGLIHPKKTKPGNPPACPLVGGRVSSSVAGLGTSVCAPGTGLPESRVSGHTGKSFCKQMPQVSSQTGQHTRSVSADPTLKIGSWMPVRVAGCAAATRPTDQRLLTRPGHSAHR